MGIFHADLAIRLPDGSEGDFQEPAHTAAKPGTHIIDSWCSVPERKPLEGTRNVLHMNIVSHGSEVLEVKRVFSRELAQDAGEHICLRHSRPVGIRDPGNNHALIRQCRILNSKLQPAIGAVRLRSSAFPVRIAGTRAIHCRTRHKNKAGERFGQQALHQIHGFRRLAGFVGGNSAGHVLTCEVNADRSLRSWGFGIFLHSQCLDAWSSIARSVHGQHFLTLLRERGTESPAEEA